MEYWIKRNEYMFPMFDPIVAEHFKKDSSYINTLLNDVNEREIYKPLFGGPGGKVFLDIGANIGLVSLYAYPSCKRIVALEPDPWNWMVLKSMTTGTNIEIFQIALAPEIGLVDFYQNDLNTTASSTVNTYGKKTRVQGWTLNEILRICQLEHVDVCKIDAEGAEGESLGFDQLLAARDIIDTYYIETHNCPKTSWNDKLGTLVESLSQLGYHKMTIDGMCLTASKP